MNKTFYPWMSLVIALCFGQITQAQIYINEVLASNAAGLTDQAGENDDWIEIYNAGGTSIDLADYYFSDDPLDPTLSQIANTDPSATTVPAGGYLLFWADKDLAQGINHLNLKLGSGGEELSLYGPDGVTFIDQLIFPGQSDDVSFGRSVDGGTDLVFFQTPSPLAENIYVPAPPGQPVTIDQQIATGNDDGEERSSGYVNLGSSDLEMVNDNGSDQTIGLRFQNILLPATATINSAYIEFHVDEVSTGPVSLNVHGDAAANSAAFTSTNGSITNRTYTSETVNWTPGDWNNVNGTGAEQITPDLAAIVAEIISTPGWAEGNAMSFMIDGSGYRNAISYNKNAGLSARLVIEAEVELNTDPISGVIINEVAPFASDLLDEEGKREDWVELYNTTNEVIQLGGLFMSDKLSSPDKWQIPAGISIGPGEYLTFFADGDLNDGILHADFSFKASGEDAVLAQLTASGIVILDAVSFSDIAFESSYARIPDVTGDFVNVGTPTPGASNNGSLLYLEPPVISLESGIYQGTQSIQISHPDPSATIRYTIDGSDPDNSSQSYSGSISVSENQAIRAIALKSGYKNSAPTNKAYLINETPNMDVIFITSDPDNFFDEEIGIYVDGVNGTTGGCAPYPVNWAQDWERPANFKMFTTDGLLAWDVNAGVQINGTCSRLNAMKSLGIYLRSKNYGDGAIEYPLYPTRTHNDFQRLKLRNSGQDFSRMGFRDMLNQQLVIGQVDLDMLEGIPTLVFLNGEFWGIHNLREKFSGEYFEAIYDVKEQDLDILKSPGIPWTSVKEGSTDIYDELFNFVQNADLNDPASIQHFEDNVDVNEFLNYWIFMTYLANYDWPANNLKVWRERVPGAKWRYGAEDTDGSTQNVQADQAKPEYNTLAAISDPNSSVWPNHSGSTLFLRKLIERSDYKAEWVQRTCSFIELFFNEGTVNAKTDAIKALYEPNVDRHLDKWGYGNAMGGSTFAWNQWIDFYKDFFATRPGYYRQFMMDQYGISGTYDLTVNFDAASGGKVLVNSNEMDLPYNYSGTYMRGLPLRLTAVPDDGYTFLYWLETGDTNPVVDYVSNSNTVLTPIFTVGNCTPGNPCNDGDDCTTNDVFDADCNCVGTFTDSDGDGVCDADDLCPGFDDNLDVNGNGIPDDCEQACTDADNDGICVDVDCDDNNAALPATPGTSCDDGNSQTTNDVYLTDGCTCAGTPVPTGNYCDSNGDFPWHDWIANVQFANINQASGKNTYSDFTSASTDINSGASYAIALTTGYSWETFDEHWKVWIDFNSDKVFDENTELVFSGVLSAPPNGTANGVLTANVTLPGFAENGLATRMRVSMSRGQEPPSCGTFPFGEVEDYTVFLGTSGPITRLDLSKHNLYVYPVPSADWVTVELPNTVSVKNVRVISATGKEVFLSTNLNVKNGKIEIGVGSWEEGLYFIQAEVAAGKWRYGKIIVTGNK